MRAWPRREHENTGRSRNVPGGCSDKLLELFSKWWQGIIMITNILIFHWHLHFMAHTHSRTRLTHTHTVWHSSHVPPVLSLVQQREQWQDQWPHTNKIHWNSHQEIPASHLSNSLQVWIIFFWLSYFLYFFFVLLLLKFSLNFPDLVVADCSKMCCAPSLKALLLTILIIHCIKSSLWQTVTKVGTLPPPSSLLSLRRFFISPFSHVPLSLLNTLSSLVCFAVLEGQRGKSRFVVDQDKIKAATLMLNRLKVSKHKQLIANMEVLISAYIELAFLDVA